MGSGRGATIGRRRFLVGAGTAAAAATLASSSGSVRSGLVALAGAARSSGVGAADRTLGPLGPLGPPDELGVRVPAGFTTTLIGRSGGRIGATGHVWHQAPDGGACFAVAGSPDVVYVSNSEVSGGAGGASAVRVDGDGRPVAAWPILTGTSRNCAGGATPWGTWLSCEENGPGGQVWECDPFTLDAAKRPALGAFNHEAVAVDPDRRRLYLTEDRPDGRLYRFTPTEWPRLDRGRLEAAHVIAGQVVWRSADPSGPDRSPSTTPFDGGEGIVVDGASLFFTTKGDRRIWELDLVRDQLSVLHDCVARPDTALTHVDNITVHPTSRHLFVAEDGGDMELCTLVRTVDGPVIAPVVRFEGHDGSEVAGPAFSPDGSTLFVSSQRGEDGDGVTIAVRGPFASWSRPLDGPAEVTRPAERVGRVEP